jgi:hypothetical protein
MRFAVFLRGCLHSTRTGTWHSSMPDRCTLTMLPADSRELLNRRRLAIGLKSVEEYEAEGRKRFIAPDCQAP